jgi:hypothetical protein
LRVAVEDRAPFDKGFFRSSRPLEGPRALLGLRPG